MDNQEENGVEQPTVDQRENINYNYVVQINPDNDSGVRSPSPGDQNDDNEDTGIGGSESVSPPHDNQQYFVIENVPGEELTYDDEEEEETGGEDRSNSPVTYAVDGITRLFACDQCPMTFKYEGHLMYHKKLEHKDSDYRCQKCNKGFDDQDTLDSHMEIHNQKYECNVCHRAFSDKAIFEKHEQTHIKVFKCKVCARHFISKEELKAHNKTHQEMFQCRVCSLKFSNSRLLDQHMKVVHVAKGKQPTHFCGVCKKKFTDKHRLALHYKTDHQKYPCKACGKAFETKQYLNNHIKVHHPKESNSVAASKESLTSMGHMKCALCHKLFQDAKFLDKHYKKMHPDSTIRFQCDICEKSFVSRARLAYHKVSHSGVEKFKCKICGKGFKYRNRLSYHMKEAHPEEFFQSPTASETASGEDRERTKSIESIQIDSSDEENSINAQSSMYESSLGERSEITIDSDSEDGGVASERSYCTVSSVRSGHEIDTDSDIVFMGTSRKKPQQQEPKKKQNVQFKFENSKVTVQVFKCVNQNENIVISDDDDDEPAAKKAREASSSSSSANKQATNDGKPERRYSESEPLVVQPDGSGPEPTPSSTSDVPAEPHVENERVPGENQQDSDHTNLNISGSSDVNIDHNHSELAPPVEDQDPGIGAKDSSLTFTINDQPCVVVENNYIEEQSYTCQKVLDGCDDMNTGHAVDISAETIDASNLNSQH